MRIVSRSDALMQPGSTAYFLEVLGDSFYIKKSQYCVCQCRCGTVEVIKASLLGKRRYSCGCLRTRVYRIWDAMWQRCTNENNQHYRHYGGRGIAVCDEWSYYPNFHEWAMESGYQDGLEIDRVDNNGNYEPSNCRWETRKTQVRNRRLKMYNAFGESKPLWAWLEDKRCTLDRDALRNRIRRGWSVEEAISTPARFSRGKSH